MKLNLGCGRLYKKGFLNIDAYDDTVADEIRDAADLKLPDNSVQRIEACQVVEHLGFVKSVYALSEWFRVLQPGGSLMIETPDIEATLGLFCRSGEKEKSDLLFWVYGTGTPGMGHKFCYPWPLLRKVLGRAGFVDIKHGSFQYERKKPALRVICNKPADPSIFHLVATFRKQLNQKGIVDFSDESEALDLEDVMDFVISRMRRSGDPAIVGAKELPEIITELAVFSPKIALCFAQQLKNAGSIQTTLEKLDALAFPRILIHLFRGIELSPGKQTRAFKLVRDMGRVAVGRLIISKKGSILDSLSKTASEIGAEDKDEEAKSFSYGVLKRLSDKLFSQGAKEFALGKYEEARKKLTDSVLLFRDNILGYLNLARILKIMGDAGEAKKNYRNALKLLDIYKYDSNSEIRRLIENEMRSKQLSKEPLASIRELK